LPKISSFAANTKAKPTITLTQAQVEGRLGGLGFYEFQADTVLAFPDHLALHFHVFVVERFLKLKAFIVGGTWYRQRQHLTGKKSIRRFNENASQADVLHKSFVQVITGREKSCFIAVFSLILTAVIFYSIL
jgi:hypothetical protein